MRSEWVTEPLQGVVSYIAKGIPPAYVEDEGDNTVRVLNQKCNRDFTINYSESRLHDLSKRSIPQEKYLRNEDILINSTGTGTAGRIAQLYNVPCPTVVDGHMIVLRGNQKIRPRYLGYALKAQQSYVLQLDEGSTGQTELNRDRLLSEIEISYPVSLDEQQAIADTLSALDAKIANNTKINNHLEQMAQAIWSERFGGREPNGALGDVIELFDFKRVPLSGNQRDKMEKIYPYYGAAALMDYVDDYLFDGIYLLLGEDGTVIDDLGFPTLQYVWGRFWVNNHAHILQGKNGFTVESLYTLLKQTSVTSIVTGAVQPKINQTNLKALAVFVPTADEMADFNALIEPLFAQMRSNRDENIRLAETRDLLLPKLMSGELSVAEAAAP